MKRTVLLVATWILGGALAVALAGAAVGRVGNEVTGSRPSPLSASEVADELASTTTTAAPASTTTATAPTTTSTTTTDGTTSTTGPSTSTTSAPVTTNPGETRTYSLVGGTATLRFSPSGVTVVAATPSPGFAVHTEPEHGNGVKVEFESEGHESQVRAWWDGAPRAEVREEAED